ncbi:MAG: hypothetical protein AABY64_12780 [Bdellovibrionota bacterium]
MSNVKGNGDVGRLKEYYTQRESDLQAKHRQSIEQTEKSHESVVNQIKDESKQEVDATIGRMKEKLSEKDIKHQQEIENLRAMYQKKIEDAKRS